MPSVPAPAATSRCIAQFLGSLPAQQLTSHGYFGGAGPITPRRQAPCFRRACCSLQEQTLSRLQPKCKGKKKKGKEVRFIKVGLSQAIAIFPASSLGLAVFFVFAPEHEISKKSRLSIPSVFSVPYRTHQYKVSTSQCVAYFNKIIAAWT